MISQSMQLNTICLPKFDGEISMLPFDLNTLAGLPKEFIITVRNMLFNVPHEGGTGFFTIHGKSLQKGETLRRPAPHTDGNYCKATGKFASNGGWKVGENGPAVGSESHALHYNNTLGGIVLASNFEACLGWDGEFEGMPGVGGDCRHIELGESFELQRNKVYYGNNHFIHESLPMSEDVHRVFARITLPINHEYNPCINFQ